MKRIMLLGCGPAQQRMINDAKKNGYYVVVCCNDPDIVENADKVFVATPDEYDRMLCIAVQEKIDGIASNRDDCMIAVADVSSTLGLVGNAPDSIDRLQNKYLFRKLQKEAGVFHPRFTLVNDAADMLIKARDFNFPVIIKPCKSSGSRGVKRIDSYDEEQLISAYTDCAVFSRNSMVMIEQYIPRTLTNLECDVFVHNGTFLWVGYETNHCAPEKPMQPRGGMFPADISSEEKLIFEETVKKLFHAADIRHGIYNIEAIFTDDNKLFIIEINARMAGATIPEVIRKQNDIDVYELLISTSVGDDTYFNYLKNSEWPSRYITNFELFPYKEGTFKGYYIVSSVRQYVYDTVIWGKIGSHVSVTKNASDSLGQIYLEYPDRELQKSMLLKLPELIYPIID